MDLCIYQLNLWILMPTGKVWISCQFFKYWNQYPLGKIGQSGTQKVQIDQVSLNYIWLVAGTQG